jgi:CO dehydrogenase/acetyl-CoA synthase alpha subunit
MKWRSRCAPEESRRFRHVCEREANNTFILITMACKVSEIVAIIDMHGYQIQNKFLCKEMGLLKVGSTVANSFFFDINLRWGDLTHKDRKTCSYVQKRIHKRPFEISELEAIVEKF